MVVEVKTGEATHSLFNVNRFGLGYETKRDIEKIRKELTDKIRKEVPRDREAKVTLNFPKTRKKPIKFSVAGEQPLEPRIIYHPRGGTPPKKLRQDIKKEWRKHPKRKTASDMEAFAYLSSASLVAPFNNQGYRIYFYLARKYLKQKGWKSFKGDMKFLGQHKTLSDYDKRELERLKDWIYKQQQKDLKQRRKRAEKLREGKK